ncbi:TolB-like translocation protein, partial [Porticoccus sp.]
MTTTAPFGCWASPIVPELLTNGLPGYAFPQFDNGNLYWLETRPWENGRSVVVRRRADGAIEDALPAPLSCRSKVHEYGGSPYIVSGNVMYFCLYDDQRVYALTLDDPEALPQPITPDAKYCFADFCVDQTRQRLICVMEDHSQSGEPQNLVAAIPLSGDMALQRLCEGEDFYAYPKLDNNGQQLCWISWNHPDMPWDNTRLWLSTLDNDGLPGTPELIAGQGDESVTQPRWSPDNHLHFVSDRNNWWNLYRLGDTHQIEALLPMSAEFATPLWTLGMSNYDF